MMTTLEMLRCAVKSINDDTPFTMDIPEGMQLGAVKSRIIGKVDKQGWCHMRHEFDPREVLEWLVKIRAVVKKNVGDAVAYRLKEGK